MYGGRSSVVRASEFKSEDLGFDPMAGQGEGHGEGQGEGQFFYPTQYTPVQTCLCLPLVLNAQSIAKDQIRAVLL